MNNSRYVDIRGIWIPGDILADRTLSFLEKTVLAVIRALGKNKGCFATDMYLASQLGCTGYEAKLAVTRLCEMGCVSCRRSRDTRILSFIGLPKNPSDLRPDNIIDLLKQ